MKLKTIYLIGGAPLSGKTTYADILAATHQAVKISTDNIRDIMLKLTCAQDYPKLFYGHNLDAVAYYKKFTTAQMVVEGEVAQGEDVAKGVRAFIDSNLPWERMVIEGIGITPELANQLVSEYPDITFETTFLYDDNLERISKRIRSRGLWGPVDTYPDYIKDLEIDWVVLYNQWYKTEAEKHHATLLHIDQLSPADS